MGELVLDLDWREAAGTKGRRADDLPEFPQPLDALLRRIAGNQRRIDGANRHAGDPIRMQVGLRQSLVDTALIGAKRTAALQDEGNTFKRRTPLDPMRFELGRARTRNVRCGHQSNPCQS
jgi:hypothetical protein